MMTQESISLGPKLLSGREGAVQTLALLGAPRASESLGVGPGPPHRSLLSPTGTSLLPGVCLRCFVQGRSCRWLGGSGAGRARYGFTPECCFPPSSC